MKIILPKMPDKYRYTVTEIYYKKFYKKKKKIISEVTKGQGSSLKWSCDLSGLCFFAL